jgi:hypothetical protein
VPKQERASAQGLLRLQFELARRSLAESDAKNNADFHLARAKHLGVPPEKTTVFGDLLVPTEPMRARLALRRLVLDAERHAGKVTIEGANPGSSPEWTPVKVGDSLIEIPKWASYYFGARTIARAPLVVRVFMQNGYQVYLDVHSAKHAESEAKAYRQQLVDKAYEIDNPFRGLTLKATLTAGIDFEVLKDFRERRAEVVLPTSVWREVDENVQGLFKRIAVLKRAELGTNRGILLVGPPGTGKTALCRVIAAELAGDVTVVICNAGVAHGWLRALYAEVAHLTPAVVIIEDLDLIVGDREEGSTNKGALAEFLNVLDGLMTEHTGVATIATTNDPHTIDAAAKRSARFDRIVDISLPDADARARILSVYLRKIDTAKSHRGREWKDGIASVAAVTDGATGADLRELVRRGVLRHGERLNPRQLVTLARDQRVTGGRKAG